MCSTKSFEDCIPVGAELMFELLNRIHHSALPPMTFLSNSERKCCGNCTDSDLKDSRADVMEAKGNQDMPYNHRYLMDT